MELNTNNISSAGLHRLDQRQRRSETFEAVGMRHGRSAIVARTVYLRISSLPGGYSTRHL